MKIIDVKLIPLRYPLKEPIRLAWGEMTHRQFALIQIETDEGITGIGETSVNFPVWSIVERKATVEQGIKPLLLGEDPLCIERLWEKMYRSLIRLGLLWGKGAIMQAISGADIALWDIAGKALGAPVFRLLGGLYQERIKLYATGFSLKEPAEGAARCVEQGYRAVKLRIGFDPERDVENVRAVREAIGDDVQLMVDANMAWDRRLAIDMAERLEEFNLYWLEEPVRCDDLEGMAAVAAATKTPIAAGENAFGRRDFKALLTARAADIIMPDVTRSGGLTECRKICSLASAWGISYSPHHYGSDVGFAASLHLLASTPGGLIMLRDVSPTLLREEVLLEPLKIEGGYAEVPQGPGLGVELNEEIISRFTFEL